jgi:NAD(P)-dependent dehydrogenase (short-subunit alcohol dehydrogenase family)
LINIDKTNTWKLLLEDVSVTELNECWAVNVVAPFLFNTKLKYLMKRKNPKMYPRFIVNVSAMEGVFYRCNKMPMHPHTNMCKAALNMMTRSSGSQYATTHIYMTSVDTGWITDENPFLIQSKNFISPLDEIDGALRCLDPIYEGLKGGKLEHSVFLKDYKISFW